MIRSQITLVTPELAAEWLAKNHRNRHLSSGLVDRYAAAISRGEWQLNGDPIRFDEANGLLDGQHRLAAVVKSKIPIRSLVLHGIPAIAQDTMDTGKKRALSDVLALRGEANSTTLGAALNVLYRIESDAWATTASPTAQQALALLARHPDLRASAPIGNRVARRVPSIRSGIATAMHYHFSHLNDDGAEADAKDFFDRLAEGANLDPDSPILVLRRTLQDYRNKQVGLSMTRIAALTIKAWNAYREGKSITFLRWSPGGANPERFPKAR